MIAGLLAGLCGFSLIAPGTKFLVTHLRKTFVSAVKWSVLFYDMRDNGPNERTFGVSIPKS